MLTEHEMTAVENKRAFLKGEIEDLHASLEWAAKDYSRTGDENVEQHIDWLMIKMERRIRQLRKIDLVFFHVDDFNTVPF